MAPKAGIKRNPIDEAVGHKIKLNRQIKGLSQTRLGELVNVSRAKIGDFESGKTSVPVSTLFLICKELGMSLDGLFGDQEEENPIKVIEELPPELAREAIHIFRSLTQINDKKVLGEFTNVIECYVKVSKSGKSK